MGWLQVKRWLSFLPAAFVVYILLHYLVYQPDLTGPQPPEIAAGGRSANGSLVAEILNPGTLSGARVLPPLAQEGEVPILINDVPTQPLTPQEAAAAPAGGAAAAALVSSSNNAGQQPLAEDNSNSSTTQQQHQGSSSDTTTDTDSGSLLLARFDHSGPKALGVISSSSLVREPLSALPQRKEELNNLLLLSDEGGLIGSGDLVDTSPKGHGGGGGDDDSESPPPEAIPESQMLVMTGSSSSSRSSSSSSLIGSGSRRDSLSNDIILQEPADPVSGDGGGSPPRTKKMIGAAESPEDVELTASSSSSLSPSSSSSSHSSFSSSSSIRGFNANLLKDSPRQQQQQQHQGGSAPYPADPSATLNASGVDTPKGLSFEHALAHSNMPPPYSAGPQYIPPMTDYDDSLMINDLQRANSLLYDQQNLRYPNDLYGEGYDFRKQGGGSDDPEVVYQHQHYQEIEDEVYQQQQQQQQQHPSVYIPQQSRVEAGNLHPPHPPPHPPSPPSPPPPPPPPPPAMPPHQQQLHHHNQPRQPPLFPPQVHELPSRYDPYSLQKGREFMLPPVDGEREAPRTQGAVAGAPKVSSTAHTVAGASSSTSSGAAGDTAGHGAPAPAAAAAGGGLLPPQAAAVIAVAKNNPLPPNVVVVQGTGPAPAPPPLPQQAKSPTVTKKTTVVKKSNVASSSSLSINALSGKTKVGGKYESGFSVPHEELCINNGRDLKVLVLITTAPDHEKHRTAVRQTWGHFAIRKDVVMAFVVGRTNNPNIQNNIDRENEIYGDIVQANFLDHYANLTLKTISMFEWVKTYCSEPHFVLKTDDDMFINMPLLLTFIDSKKADRRVMYGRLAKGWKPVRNKKSKYYIDVATYKKTKYPDFLTGPAYLFTSDIVDDIYKKALGTTFFVLEDVLVTGIVGESLRIRRVGDSRFRNEKIKLTDTCSLINTISIHMVKYEEQFDIYKRTLDGKAKCKTG